MERTPVHSPLGRHFSPWGLLCFTAPSIGMMLVISLYTITDGIFIGQFAGSAALAAVNIVYPLMNLIFGLSIMFASGGSALVSRNLGEGRPEEARRRFSLLLLALTGLSLLLALVTWLGGDALLHQLGATPELVPLARTYLGILLPFYPAAALMILANGFFIVDGRPWLGLLVSVCSGLTNAVLDYVFLSHLGLGIFGAGLATGLADLLAALIGLIYFARFSRSLRFTVPRWEGNVLRQTLFNGSSELVTELSVGITTFLFNRIMAEYAGTDGIAAISVILYSEMLLTAVYTGFTSGAAPLYSFHYGARNMKELRHLLRLSLLFLAGGAVLSFTVARSFAVPLIALFLPGGGAAFALTLHGFRLFSLSFLLSGFNLFFSGFFTALSDGRTSALLSFCRNLAGIVFYLLLLPKLLGIDGIWLAVPAADLTVLLPGFWCVRQRIRALVTLYRGNVFGGADDTVACRMKA